MWYYIYMRQSITTTAQAGNQEERDMEIKTCYGMRTVEAKIELPNGTVLTVTTTQFAVDAGMPDLGWSSRDWSSRYEASNGGKIYSESQLKLRPETKKLVDEAIKSQQIALGVYIDPATSEARELDLAQYEASNRRIEAMGNMGDAEAEDADAEQARLARAEQFMGDR